MNTRVYEDYGRERGFLLRDLLCWLDIKWWSRSHGERIVNGYRQIFDKARRRWVFEHRQVAERMINKRIPKGYEVHHINGDKLDNRQKNLVVITREKHRHIHAQAKAAAESRAEYLRALKDAYLKPKVRNPEGCAGAARRLKKAECHTRGLDKEISWLRSKGNQPKVRVRARPAEEATANVVFRPRVLGRVARQKSTITTRTSRTSRCSRCGGSGYISRYRHVSGGVCFSCGGRGHN